jgi:hypothetical protein
MEQIQPYLDRFGRKKIFLLLTEDLREEPGQTVSEILSLLGVGWR